MQKYSEAEFMKMQIQTIIRQETPRGKVGVF